MFERIDNVVLAPYATFRIGGVARYFITVTQQNDLGAALDFALLKNTPLFILGGGSNVLVSDEGFAGVVIHIMFANMTLAPAKNQIHAEAGALLSAVVFYAASNNLAGAERLYGIPGTLGGAVRGNAGAFGTEMGDITETVTALHRDTREVRVFSREECAFDYRTSFFKTHPEWIILSATLQLKNDETYTALPTAVATLAVRNARQIQQIQSAGSFFMNPVVPQDLQDRFKNEGGIVARKGRIPAGWLIESAGFKHMCRGQVCTGERSANYIINTKHATAHDVRALGEEIQKAVYEKFSVMLQREVMQVGFTQNTK